MADTVIKENNIDKDLIGGDKRAILMEGGSRKSGYKHSSFYTVNVFYIPEIEDCFVVRKSSIMGGSSTAFDSLSDAIQRVNRTIKFEEGFEFKSVNDKYDVKDYVIPEEYR